MHRCTTILLDFVDTCTSLFMEEVQEGERGGHTHIERVRECNPLSLSPYFTSSINSYVQVSMKSSNIVAHTKFVYPILHGMIKIIRLMVPTMLLPSLMGSRCS
jgi:hypothetical protein